VKYLKTEFLPHRKLRPYQETRYGVWGNNRCLSLRVDMLANYRGYERCNSRYTVYSNDSALKCQVVDVMTRCGSCVSGIDWNINWSLV